jgi:hypothetical protein
MTPERNALAKLATEYWRLLRIAEKVVVEVTADKMASLSAQIRYSTTRLHSICSEGGLRLVSYDRVNYEPNLPVTVSNGDEMSSEGDMVIERTLEPTIMADGQIVALGKVQLRKRG